MLASFDNYVSDGSQGPNSPMLATIASNSPLTSILDGRGRSLKSPRTTLYFGPCSSAALICAILEFFDNTDSSILEPLIVDIFKTPTATFLESEAPETLMNMGIPNQEEIIDFLHTIRQHTHPSFQMIQTEEFIKILGIAYANEASNTPSIELAFIHAAAALGYLLSTEQHTEKGCSWNMSKSAEHHRISMTTITHLEASDNLSLLVCVYLIFYDCCCFKMSEAYTMLYATQSLIIRQGLIHAMNEYGPNLNNGSGPPLEQLIISLEVIDCLVSTTLGLPRVMGTSAPALLEPIARDDSGIDARLHSVYSLTANVASLMSDIGTAILSKNPNVRTKQSIDQGILDQADQALTRSANMLENPAGPREKESHTRAPKQGLLTTFWWAELTFYSPFLHYLQPLAEGQSLPSNHSEPALKCLKAATNAITTCEVMLRSRTESPLYLRIMHPGNPGTVSALFTSTLSLIFLICVHKGTKPPGEAWKRAEMGIRLLEALRCDAGGAGRCLAIIQEVVRQLNRFVRFDFDHIRRTTRRICSDGDDRARSHSMFTYPDNSPATPLVGHFHHSPSYVSSSADEMLAYARHLNQVDTEP